MDKSATAQATANSALEFLREIDTTLTQNALQRSALAVDRLFSGENDPVTIEDVEFTSEWWQRLANISNATVTANQAIPQDKLGAFVRFTSDRKSIHFSSFGRTCYIHIPNNRDAARYQHEMGIPVLLGGFGNCATDPVNPKSFYKD